MARHHLVAALAPAPDGHVGLVAEQVGPVVARFDHDLELRIGGHEFGQMHRQQLPAVVVRDRYAQPPRHRAAARRQTQHDVVQNGQHVLGRHQELPPLLRERKARGAAMQQQVPDRRLQPLELARSGRLGYVQHIGCRSQSSELGGFRKKPYVRQRKVLHFKLLGPCLFAP